MADCTDPTMGLLRILRFPDLLGTLEQSTLLKILRCAAKRMGSLAGEFCVLFKEWTLYKRSSARCRVFTEDKEGGHVAETDRK